VEHCDASGRAIEKIDDVVELRREQVNVFAINWRHEAAVDSRTDVVREHVRFVFDGLYRGDVVIELVGLCEEESEQPRRFFESLREFVEEGEESFVAWDEAHRVSSGVDETTRVVCSIAARASLLNRDKDSRDPFAFAKGVFDAVRSEFGAVRHGGSPFHIASGGGARVLTKAF
jgi:hypothetical protein